jgi:hypothetical protein
MKSGKWSWWEILLWAYSTIYSAFLVVLFVIGASGPSTGAPIDNFATAVVMIVLTLPVLIFLVLEGIKHLKEVS